MAAEGLNGHRGWITVAERSTCRREVQAVDTEQDLIILTYVDYIRLRRELKAAGFDLCYTAQVEQPVRLDWSPHLMHDRSSCGR